MEEMRIGRSFFEFGVGGSPALGNSPLGKARRTEPKIISLWNRVELMAYETYIRMEGIESFMGTTAKYYLGERRIDGRRVIRTQRVQEDADLRKILSQVLKIGGYKSPYIF